VLGFFYSEEETMKVQTQAHSSKRQTAIRLVSTKDMPRSQWLSIRNQGIGASEAATAIGINPYQSQLELWMIKTGRMSPDFNNDQEDSSSPMYWGNVLEPIVAEHYSRKTGFKVRRVNSILQHPDSDKAWMLANLDYAVSGSDEVQVLECKTAGEYGAKLWKDGVPEYYQCQVQHQLAITGKQTADVAVLLCGQEFRIYRMQRDDELIDQLIELEREFWSYVESDTAPPADGSDSANQALRMLYPKDTGTTIDLSDDSDLELSFQQLTQVRSESQILSNREDELRQMLQQRMGTASTAIFSSGKITWRKSKDSLSLNAKQLLKDKPELIEQYPLTRPGSRRFIIQSNTTDNQGDS